VAKTIILPYFTLKSEGEPVFLAGRMSGQLALGNFTEGAEHTAQVFFRDVRVHGGDIDAIVFPGIIDHHIFL